MFKQITMKSPKVREVLA